MKLMQMHVLQWSALTILGAAGFLARPTARAASYPDTVMADKPVAYYRFEDQVGSTAAVDSSGAGAYPGLLNFDLSGVWPKLAQPGIGSNSVSFHLYNDGGVLQKSWVSVPYTTELNVSGPFTVEGWARPTSVGGSGDWRSPIGNFAGWGDPNTAGWFFYQSPGDPGPSQWIWVQKGGGIWVGGVPVRRGQWDYLAASFDGKTVTFYVNGVNSGSADASTALPNAVNALCIGQRADNNCFLTATSMRWRSTPMR